MPDAQFRSTPAAAQAADKLTNLVLELPGHLATVEVLRIIIRAEQVGFDRAQRELESPLWKIRLSSSRPS